MTLSKTKVLAKPAIATTKARTAKVATPTPRTKREVVSTVMSTHTMAEVPDEAYLTKYVQRVLKGGRTDLDALAWHDSMNHNVLIEGPTGLGKTMASMAYAHKAGKAFYAIPSNVGIEPSQLFGKIIPDGNNGWKWVDGPVTWIVRHGGVLLLNEVNFIPERVATVLFGLLDGRRAISLLDHEGEVIKAHPDLLVIADMNPDYAGTRPLNMAFRNRFAVQWVWDYDPQVEAKLIKSPVLRNFAGKVRSQIASGAFDTPLSTNMLMEFEEIVFGMGYDYAVDNMVTHFNSDEREAMKTLLATHRGTLEADVTKAPETEDQINTRRRNMKKGEIDAEWGIKGEDWLLDDENPADFGLGPETEFVDG